MLCTTTPRPSSPSWWHCASGEAHFFEPDEPFSELTDRRDGLPLAPLEIRSTDSRLLTPADTAVRELPVAED